MSHIAKIKLQIKDLNLLKRACERLDLRFVENQKTYTGKGYAPDLWCIPKT